MEMKRAMFVEQMREVLDHAPLRAERVGAVDLRVRENARETRTDRSEAASRVAFQRGLRGMGAHARARARATCALCEFVVGRL